MAKKSKQTFQKREKEKARVQKRKDKEARRLESKELKANMTTVIGDEDPDIAGIRPGPQPLPEQWDYVDDDSVNTMNSLYRDHATD
jgi:hypothetical protein